MATNMSFDRRRMLELLAGIATTAATGCVRAASASERVKTGLGLVIYTHAIQLRAEKSGASSRGLRDPLTFLEHCRTLGAGGIQVPLGVKEPAACQRLRETAAVSGMFIEGIVDPPFEESDLPRFRAEIETAARVGAEVVRTVIIPGRRYERFASPEEFDRFAQRGRRALERAKPIVEKQQIQLAVENHKDQRLEERLPLLEKLDSPFVGACVDVGNSFALLEDPLTVVQSLAPYASTVHLKDQAVQEHQDGFLLADVALGDGFLQLARMVEVLRRARPEVHFCLESITRDPLRIPCLSESYWPTFRHVRASELAGTLRTVRGHAVTTLPEISHLPLAEQVAAERRTVHRSLRYAQRQLGI